MGINESWPHGEVGAIPQSRTDEEVLEAGEALEALRELDSLRVALEVIKLVASSELRLDDRAQMAELIDEMINIGLENEATRASEFFKEHPRADGKRVKETLKEFADLLAPKIENI